MRDPVVVAFDFILDRTAVTVGARAVDKPLLDQPAGQLVELRRTARSRDAAAPHPPVRLDREDEADPPADAGVAKAPRIIIGRDFAGNLLEVGAAVVVAITVAAPPSSCASADRRTAALASA